MPSVSVLFLRVLLGRAVFLPNCLLSNASLRNKFIELKRKKGILLTVEVSSAIASSNMSYTALLKFIWTKDSPLPPGNCSQRCGNRLKTATCFAAGRETERFLRSRPLDLDLPEFVGYRICIRLPDMYLIDVHREANRLLMNCRNRAMLTSSCDTSILSSFLHIIKIFAFIRECRCCDFRFVLPQRFY